MILSSIISAQNNSYTIERITNEAGLSQNSGLSILQDSNGFIWIGTGNGLNKYDGTKFTVYKNDKNDSNSISNNYINSLFEDKDGTLWIGTNQGGLNCFNKYREEFTSYKHNPLDSNSIGPGSIYAIYQDNFGNLWIAVNPSGLYFFDRQNQIFKHFWLPPKNREKGITNRTFSIVVDENNDIWVGGSNGLFNIHFTFVPDTVKEKSLLNDFNFLAANCKINFWNDSAQKNKRLTSSNVSSILIEVDDSKKNIFLGLWPGLSKIEITNADTNIINYSTSRSFWRLFKDSYNTMWLGEYNNGISFFDSDDFSNMNNLTELFSSDANYSISDWTIRFITEDFTGNIWAGSEQFGVLKISKNIISTRLYRKLSNNKNTISGDFVTKIMRDSKNRIWVGTRFNGLNRFELTNDGSIINLHVFTSSDNKNSIPHNYISDIFEDSKGRIWVSAWNIKGGLALYNPQSNNFTRFQHIAENPNSLAENQITAIAEDKNGNILLSTSERGFDKFNYEKNVFKHFVSQPANESSLSSNTITSIFVDSSGEIWIGTFGEGLNKYDVQKNEFLKYSITPGERKISDNRINGFYQDNKGNLWVLTANGVNKINSPTGKIQILLKSNPSDNVIYSMTQDKNSDYWLTTSSGLIKIDHKTDIIYTYGAGDGLPNTDFSSRSLELLKNGNLLIGTKEGLLELSPNDISEKFEKTGNVVLTSFKVFDEELLLDTVITFKKNILLNYDQNFFSVQFSLLDFDNPSKNLYKYRIKGLFDEWSKPSHEKYINFVNVPHGDYKLEVLGSNQNGVWSLNPASINISIIPPFWRTDWFRLTAALALMSLIFYVIRWITSRKYRIKLRKLEIEQKIREERERISSDLHDNIGSNLSGIVTGLEITKNHFSKFDKERILNNISLLEAHTRQTIDLLRGAIWSLQDEVKTCGDLIDKVREFLSHRIVSENQPQPKLVYNLDKQKPITPFNSLNLFRIIQESVNNSVKYSNSRNIDILFSETEEGRLRIEIIDYGTGFDIQKIIVTGKGFGLQNMKKRAEKIGAKLEILSNADAGTKILIEL